MTNTDNDAQKKNGTSWYQLKSFYEPLCHLTSETSEHNHS